MKILVLTYWGDEGGVYVHLKNIYTRILKYPDVEVQFVALNEKDWTGNTFGAPIYLLKRKKSRGSNYFYNPHLIKKKILELDPTLIHIHTTINSHAIAALMLPKKYPIVITIHQTVTDDLKSRLLPSIKQYIKLKIEPYLEKKMLEKARCVIVPSPHMIEFYSSMKSKIRVIPNGVDVEEMLKCDVNESLQHPSLLFAGRLEKVKGVDTLIKAIPCILKSISNIHLYIAGSGDEKYELCGLVKKLNIEKHVTFLGFVQETDIYSYFKSIDICVLPSRFETFGLAALEAMACSKPIVASNVGGIPYIVEDGTNGFLFESDDVQDLAEKLITLLQNKEMREKMGKAGFKRAKEFSWNEIVGRTVGLYRELLASGDLECVNC